MRKIIAGFASSTDGYITGPNGEYDWILIDKEIDFTEEAKKYDTYLFGRKTYEAAQASGTPPMAGNRNYVFSRTLESVDPNYILIRDDVPNQVQKLKEEEGKDIALFGGASLLTSLLELHLVDELTISVIPVLLGKGRPMIGELKNKISLSLIGCRTYGNGTVQTQYSICYPSR